MENLLPQAEIIPAENEIPPNNNVDIDENYESDEDEGLGDDSDSDDTSLMVMLPDEYGEPPLRMVAIPAELDHSANFDTVSDDGDMPVDLVSDEEIEELSNNGKRVRFSRKRKFKGRYTYRKSRNGLTFRYGWKHRSNSMPRMRSRSPHKRLTLTLSKTRPET